MKCLLLDEGFSACSSAQKRTVAKVDLEYGCGIGLLFQRIGVFSQIFFSSRIKRKNS
jgi:hypothetical protein